MEQNSISIWDKIKKNKKRIAIITAIVALVIGYGVRSEKMIGALTSRESESLAQIITLKDDLHTLRSSQEDLQIDIQSLSTTLSGLTKQSSSSSSMVLGATSTDPVVTVTPMPKGIVRVVESRTTPVDIYSSPAFTNIISTASPGAILLYTTKDATSYQVELSSDGLKTGWIRSQFVSEVSR